MYVRYKWESKPFNMDDEAPGIDIPEHEPRQQVRLHVDRRIGQVKLRSRFEWIGMQPNDDEKKNGYMIYQDLVWNSPIWGNFCLTRIESVLCGDDTPAKHQSSFEKQSKKIK